MKHNLKIAAVSVWFLLFWLSRPMPANAATYPLPPSPEDSVIGEVRYVTAGGEETLLDIGRANDLGYEEIIKPNPKVNRWVPGDGTRVLLPTAYVLPDTQRGGIVLNLPELRLYYYPPAKKGVARVVKTYPVSIGRMDWRTPLGKTKVVKKLKDPPWYPTPAVRREHEEEGDVLPAFIPGGTPENPLGRFALRLGLPQYLIHGTDERKAFGIGMRVTHGCVRMYPEDIQELFAQVAAGTQVMIVDQPIKVGRLGKGIYIEVNAPFEEEGVEHVSISYERAIQMLRSKWNEPLFLDEELVNQAVQRGDGVPALVGEFTERSW